MCFGLPGNGAVFTPSPKRILIFRAISIPRSRTGSCRNAKLTAQLRRPDRLRSTHRAMVFSRNRWRSFIDCPFEHLARDVLRNVSGPALRGVEGDHPERLAVLAGKKIADDGLAIGFGWRRLDIGQARFVVARR
jgi:hypothetical protein